MNWLWMPVTVRMWQVIVFQIIVTIMVVWGIDPLWNSIYFGSGGEQHET